MERLIIIGAGGFGREVLWLAREINRVKATYEIVGFLDDNVKEETISGVPVLGTLEKAERYAADPGARFVVAIGEPEIKQRVVKRLEGLSPRYATLIDPSVRGDWDRISIGEGSIICAGTVLTTDISISNHVILNLMVNVGHDTKIDSYSTVAPASTISGGVKLGNGTYLGSGCIIRDEVTVGDWSIVGMGAVVTKDVPPEVVVAGVPAQTIRANTNRRVW